MFGSFSDRLSVRLADFLSNKPDSGAELSAFLKTRVAWYCASHAPSLPSDLREDVLQECILVLYTRGMDGFRAGDGTAAGYVYHTVRGALQSVLRRHGMSHDVLQAETDEGVDLIETSSESVTCGPLPSPNSYDSEELVVQALKGAGPEFGGLMWRVFVNGERRAAVLAEANMSRFAFERRRKALAKSLAALPKCA